MPANFSVAYAFAFCAGVYFRGATAWWLPLGTMLATDVALNIFYYHVAPFAFYLLLNYAIFAVLIGLGKCFGRRASFLKDRKSTRLNSSHLVISYAVFCLKKKIQR